MRKFINIINEALDLYKRDYHDLITPQLAKQLQENGFDIKYLLFHGSDASDLKTFDRRKAHQSSGWSIPYSISNFLSAIRS